MCLQVPSSGPVDMEDGPTHPYEEGLGATREGAHCCLSGCWGLEALAPWTVCIYVFLKKHMQTENWGSSQAGIWGLTVAMGT